MLPKKCCTTRETSITQISVLPGQAKRQKNPPKNQKTTRKVTPLAQSTNAYLNLGEGKNV